VSRNAEVIVGGHLCLDIIPKLNEKKDTLFVPGKLVDVGKARISTGGAVPNTGIALHRLGFKVNLLGKIGDDQFGQIVLETLRKQADDLIDGLIVQPGEQTSYTLVISPPQTDRIFFHCPGANDTFLSSDIRDENLKNSRLFHFGYPPLMRTMYENNGLELALLLKRVKDLGLTVSLDMARPDPESQSGMADWRSILKNSLPYVDVFLPSFEEMLYMLHRDRYEQFIRQNQGSKACPIPETLLSEMTEELLEMGVVIVGLKLGEHGLYIRTSANQERFLQMGRCTPKPAILNQWLNRKLLSTCYEVNFVGSTGAGDCTIAGFLAGLLSGLSIEETLNLAVGAGACNVEEADAVSGIPSWDELHKRISNGWNKRLLKMELKGWILCNRGMWEAL
jgi:sugar/nucleoside kinase (ribokinase family)